MRITCRIASAGREWLPQFPKVCSPSELFKPDGKGNSIFNEADARESLANPCNSRYIMLSDKDTPLVYLVAVFLIDAVNHWFDENKIIHDKATVADGHLNRKVKRGRESVCRLTLTGSGKTVRAKVDSTDNGFPQVNQYERVMAGIIAENLLLIRDNANKLLAANFEFDESISAYNDALLDLRKHMDERDAIEEANARRIACEFRHGDWCSPCQFGCRCYKDGRCVEAGK